jgi:two-component system nitrogen regulation sensor histidine kinase GlnL
VTARGTSGAGTLRRVLDELGALRTIPRLEGLEPDDPEHLALIAEALASEVERCQREIIEARVQFLSLHEVATGMLALAEPEKAAEEIAHYLQRAFAFDQVFLFVAGGAAARLAGRWRYPRANIPPSRALVLDPHASGPHGGVTRSFRTGSPALVACAEKDPPFLPQEIVESDDDGLPVHSYAVVPLSSARDALRVLGVLGIASSDPERPVQRADAVTLESIAASVAALTENAMLYQALKRSERFRENLLDCVGSAVLAVGLDGRILAVNRVAEKMTGFAEAEAMRRPAWRLLPSGGGGPDPLGSTLQDGTELLRVEAELIRADGTRLPVSLTTSLLLDESDRVSGAIATFVDLTPLREMEERVRQLDRLAALGRFTAGIAHEIRNPLAGIAAGVQYLARHLAEDESQQRNIGFLTGEIERLDRILQDLARASHPASPVLGPCRLPEVVERAVQALSATAAERGIRFDVEADPALKEALADADQIQQVLLNLLKNACEASPAGSTVRVEMRPSCATRREGAAPMVEVRVRDEGAGIKGEDRSRIFEPFFTTKSSGTGLGLYLSHGIAERHGGSLTAESSPGTGATFVLALPAVAEGTGEA